MKITVKDMAFRDVLSLPQAPHTPPKKPNLFFRTLVKAASFPELKRVHMKIRKIGMEQLKKNTPCLILMNHSGFLDLKIAESAWYPRPLNIVCTEDGFVGQAWLMKNLGCIPTKKFVPDLTLLRDMKYALTKLRSSVLMYPEASYSFDGTATPLPSSLGRCLKHLSVPVVMIRTYGAFAHDPLYNGLRLRQVDVSADIKYLLSPEQIAEKTADELNDILKQEFTFDNFRWQQENHIKVTEPFRAEGLNRVLYRCPHCQTEGKTVGHGVTLTCNACGKVYTLDETGYLQAEDGDTAFSHIPDWYAWERACVRKELENGTYAMKAEVDICILRDTACIYRVGSGTLTHTAEGFHLTGCDGEIDYIRKPCASYSLYADYYWYEIGDMICIGDNGIQYYCFPKNTGDIVAKTRLATEELYRISMASRRIEK